MSITSLPENISSLLPLIPSLAAKKCTLPDKIVASQVLMYRQLLQTKCKPGLRLSRGFQGTEAQTAVMRMPWWEQGVEQTKRMVISYDNLIVRLWLNGAIMPYVDGGYASAHSSITVPKDEEPNDVSSLQKDRNLRTSDSEDLLKLKLDPNEEDSHINTLIDERGLPPIPHTYWVDRLGFQQTDPITDFRSGGVLSLAMLVHLVEACPEVHARFLPSGDAHILPYGITCINVTDMIARFCMFSKSVDRIDALLSQKPFWRLFTDPNALLVLQELSIDMLCDVVVEMGKERNILRGVNDNNDSINFHGQDHAHVSVFDFAEILARTEKRVHNDLLGAGPQTVAEMRTIHARLCMKYERAMEKMKRKAQRDIEQRKEVQQIEKSGGIEKSILGVAHIVKNVRPLRATLSMTGNVINSAESVWNKYSGKLNFRQLSKENDGNNSNKAVTTDEIHFMMPPSPSVNEIKSGDSPNLIDLENDDEGASLQSNKYINVAGSSSNISENYLETAFTIDENDIDDLY